MMRFVGGPLDGQETSHSPEACPQRLYVRETGRGFSSWAYMFLVPKSGESPSREFMACEQDFDPTRLWVYEKNDDTYTVSPMPSHTRSVVSEEHQP